MKYLPLHCIYYSWLKSRLRSKVKETVQVPKINKQSLMMKKLHQVVQATLKPTLLKHCNQIQNAKSTARATTSRKFKQNDRSCLPKSKMWHWLCNLYEMKKTFIIAINYTCALKSLVMIHRGWMGKRTTPEGLRANFIFVHSFLPSARNSSANGFKFHRKSSDYHSSSGRSSSRGWKGKVNNLVLSTAILPFVLRDQRQAWEDLMSVKLWRRSGLRKARSGQRYRRRTS